MTTIIFANDHAGVKYKDELIDFLKHNELVKELYKKDINIIDIGCSSTDSVDYPDYVHKAISTRSANPDSIVVLICGSGNGVSMTANKYPNIRGALCWNKEIAELARSHNDANVLWLPARFISIVDARSILLTFLTITFEGGRHQRRINKMANI